jgi:hypothetical protein
MSSMKSVVIFWATWNPPFLVSTAIIATAVER